MIDDVVEVESFMGVHKYFIEEFEELIVKGEMYTVEPLSGVLPSCLYLRCCEGGIVFAFQDMFL